MGQNAATCRRQSLSGKSPYLPRPRLHASPLLHLHDPACRLQSRKDVEGSLFLVKRRLQPRFQFIILNKKSAGEGTVSSWGWGAERVWLEGRMVVLPTSSMCQGERTAACSVQAQAFTD